MLPHSLSRLAVPSVTALISVLAYPSQYFLLAAHFSRNQHIFFNVLVACIWTTYFRTVFTDPGSPPPAWTPSGSGGLDAEEGRGRGEQRRLVASTTRWCKRCERFKPARTHHCRTCKRCVLKMDHHCPWTASCIGFRNLPHFLRFIFFASTTCAYLLLQLSYRALAVWNARHLSSFYAPHTTPQLTVLAVLLLIGAPVTVALIVLFIRTIAQAAEGYTTIETWELERHHALVRKKLVRKQVFPYDIGIWDNLVVAFGGVWFFPLWWNPFARSPVVGAVRPLATSNSKGKGVLAGLEWEVNGFEDPDLEWPPRDPEKEGRIEALKRSGAFTIMEDSVEFAEGVRQRMRADLLRRARMREAVKGPGEGKEDWYRGPGGVYDSVESLRPTAAKGTAHALYGYDSIVSIGGGGGGGVGVGGVGVGGVGGVGGGGGGGSGDGGGGGEGYGNDSILGSSSIFSEPDDWRNAEGERLADYGVDEELEEEDEDVPLAILMQRRRQELERVGGVLGEISENLVA